jgi:hypothetical protein
MLAAVRLRGVSGAVLLVLGVLALALRTLGVTAPFGADNLGTAAGFFSIAARNYPAYGYLATRLVPVVTPDGPPSPAVFYANHPPLVPLLVSGSFALFGEHEWAARLVPLLASLASLVLLARLAARFHGDRVALLTLALAATLPLDAHLAAHVDVQGSVLLAAVLAFVLALAERRSAAAFGWLTVALLIDWPALYLPVLLALAPWPFAHARPRRLVAGLLAWAVVLFATIVSWLSGFGAIVALVRERAFSFRADDGRPFDLAGWLDLVVGTYLWELCTPVASTIVLVWATLRIPSLVRRPHPDRLALFLLLFGVAHMVVGFQGAYQHEFWAHYLRAGVPLACALGIERVGSWLPSGRLRAASVVALVAVVMGSGALGTLRLAAHPLSARMIDEPYTPRDLARAIRACTPAGAGALTSDYYGEGATFYYAARPLAVAVLTPDALADALRAPRYDVPGGTGRRYAAEAAPSCFVLPPGHDRLFPELVRELRRGFPSRMDGAFETFALVPGAPRRD